jgi:hypothetical protein
MTPVPLTLDSLIYSKNQLICFTFPELHIPGDVQVLVTLKYQLNSKSGWTTVQNFTYAGDFCNAPHGFRPASPGNYQVILRFRFENVTFRYSTAIIRVG